MTAIEFTAIPDTDSDYQLQLELLVEFRKQTDVEVKLTRMEWSDAWGQLIDISTHGQGADISHVGSTWVSSLMSLPSSGGGNLVIWRHTYGYPDRLEAAFKLAEFLTRKSTMLEVGCRAHILPSRVDALDELIPRDHPLRPVMIQLVSSARTYLSILLWRRIENQFGQELSVIAKALFENEDAELDVLLSEIMGRLTQRLNLTLG